MKTIVGLIAAFFFVLLVLSFVPYPAARDTAREAGFSESDIEIGLQYSFERRFFSWTGTLLHLGVLCALALTICSRRVADRFLAWFGDRRILGALAVGLVYLVLLEIYRIPLGIGRFYHTRAWGMSERPLIDWLRDHFLAFGINLVLQAIVCTGLYALLIYVPRIWWLIAPVGASILGIAYAMFAPIVISPLFNEFTPLSETKWSDQQSRVQALIDAAGIPVQDILVMNGSRQSTHANAYFTGFGPTRRIVLYDTLLKKHSPEEIESVLAHEIGHWQNDHIVKGILLGTLAAFFGCFLLDRLLRLAMSRGPWQLKSVADPAGLTIILLCIFLAEWGALPITNGVSRYFERQADQASLELARQPMAFMNAERNLSTGNKSNVAAAPWNTWLYSTHPTSVERIRRAQDWLRSNPLQGTPAMNPQYIDAHVHVWTDDTTRYPLAAGFKKEDVKPTTFTAEELFKHCKPAGVQRIALIQISFYGFDNSYMLDAIAKYPEVFVGTAVINPHGKDPAAEMAALAKKGIRAFRIHPKLSGEPAEKWLQPEGFKKMFAAGARNNQAMACLIGPDGLAEVDRMCKEFPDTPVIIDHLARIGAEGEIRDVDVARLCALARHKKVMVKVGAFYALAKKKPPYDDLAPTIKKVVAAFGAERCMWESDSPFQVQGEHTYQASVDLVLKRLDFLSETDRDWLMRKTAQKFFFGK